MLDAGRRDNSLPRDGIFADYRPEAGVFDEMVAPNGAIRSPWEQFVVGLNQLGKAGLVDRTEQVKRSLRETGATYSAAGAPSGPDRPWELDPLPLLFDQGSWSTLADGLRQRATVLNLILADVYGPQRLIREGVLPPEIVFENPAYLVPCHSITPPGNPLLCLYAAHLARQPDGRWLVVADRTRGPSGTGYSLENRIAVSRALRGDFESLHIERLAPFFLAMRDRLNALAPAEHENPRIVLLSPGVTSPTFFEDGYMARYLGYTLVEGADLTVRGGVVYLKTLGGLLPVDVILRRIPDETCDPLELKPNSLGTAGLVQAIRDRTVVVANSIGSGFSETPALAAFLPMACRLLLGEELHCPSVPTWWCGRNEDLRFVEANLSQLTIRHALKRRHSPPIMANSLTSDQQSKLLDEIRKRPGHFVAQQSVERSTVPVWTGAEIAVRCIELRTFALSTVEGYRIMPGGLARVFHAQQTIGESMAAGETSKDVWVLANSPVEQVTLLRQPLKPIELRRGGADLPSRIADNLFWLGRHAERAEAMARHLRSATVRLTSDVEPNLNEVFQLVDALSDIPGGLPRIGQVSDAELTDRLRQTLVEWLFLAERAGALANTLHGLRNTASQVRDRLSIDGWRIINQLSLSALFPTQPQPEKLGDLVLLLNQILNLLAALAGLNTESMTRGLGWRFLDMGRRIERSLQILRLIRRMLVDGRSDPIPLLEAILEMCDSSMTYRYRYRASLQLAPVLDLLLIDGSNPRSVGYQLNALSEHVAVLPVAAGDPGHMVEQEIMMAAQATARLTDVDALCEGSHDGLRDRLESLLTQLEDQLRGLSNEITHHYLAHTGTARQLRTVPASRVEELRLHRSHAG
jgi:uncharacterized circularly permuted ATP-grasp superfamily protein/uncharacterized alpha-E superfamily protein